MIVVDVNIVTYLVLRGEYTQLAISVTEKDDDWRAPQLWASEMRNVLAGYYRRGALTLQMAMHAYREAEISIREVAALDSPRVFELISSSKCTAYDCEYVATAEHLDVPLVTNDKQILRDFPRTAISMQAFLNS